MIRFLPILFGSALIIGSVIVIPLPSLAFGLPKLLFFSVAAFCGLVIARIRAFDLHNLFNTWAGRFFLVLCGIILLSPLWSIAPILSIVGAPPRFEGVLTQLTLMSLFIVGIGFAQSENHRDLLIRCIVISNVIIVLYGFLQVIGFDPLAALWMSESFLGRTFSFLGQPTYLGQFILLTLPFVGMRWMTCIDRARLYKKIKTMWWASIAFLNIIVLMGTASRAAFLGLIVMAILGGIVLLPHLRRPHVVIIGAVSLVIISFGALRLAERFSVATQDFFLGSRSVIWETSLNMIKERPYGYGLETLGIASQSMMPADLKKFESLTTKIDRGHSKPLDLLLTLGVQGFIAYYGMLVFLLYALWKKRSFVAFVSLTSFSVALLFGFESPATFAFFWLIAGSALGMTKKENLVTGYWSLVITRWSLVIGIFVTTVTIIMQAQWMRARVGIDRGSALLSLGKLEPAIQAYAQSTEIIPFDRQALIESTETALIGLEQAGDAHTHDTLNAFISTQLQRLQKLTGYHDGMVPALAAWQSAALGDQATTEHLIAVALQMMPVDITAYRMAAHSYLVLSDLEKKREIEQRLINILPPYWNDPQSEKGRILRKEHPWVEEL